MSKNYVQALVLASIDSSTMSSSTTFYAINSAGLTKPCSLIRIVNNSNQDMTISYDGTNAHDFCPKASEIQLPFQSNAQPNSNMALIAQGTVVYVKAASAGMGLVYLAGYYQDLKGS
ncbi:MAG TPA: hypothetical protein VNZ45_02650 [Bacteroidia bacterium]|jgi:hypothetical protein|nr:hypothetical protein [Bacteroidia bacterium]